MMSLPGGPTKDEVMAVVFQKLGLLKSDVFIDIGCGTGKISINAAPLVKWVYGVDMRIEAVNHASDLAAGEGIGNAEFVCEDAGDFLEKMDSVDAAFVGGSKDLTRVLSILAKKHTRAIVVNAVLIETVNKAISEMKGLGIYGEAILVSVSRAHPLGQGTMFRPLDPVYIISGGCREC